MTNSFNDYSELSLTDAMTCQELLAFSVAFSAALPTSQTTLETFYSTLQRNPTTNPQIQECEQDLDNIIRLNSSTTALQPYPATITGATAPTANNLLTYSGNSGKSGAMEDFSCCYDLYQNQYMYDNNNVYNNGGNSNNISGHNMKKKKKRSKFLATIITIYKIISKILHLIRKYVKLLVEHKYFQQGILLAILINTLSMGIEYHNQPEELTAIVETSNIVFSAIFAVEMLLKVIAEGPFRYVANGFNVFDGVIVILR